MKRLTQVLFLAVIFSLAGCASMPPIEIKPVTPNLNIAPTGIRPLHLGVVIADPMPYSIFYRGEGSYRRDMTADFRSSGLMLERDLSKIVQDTLSQAFHQVVILRDLPQPGQYDAVVNIGLGQVLAQERVILTGETCDVTAAWTLSVLDHQNKEFFKTNGVSLPHNFKWSAFNPGPGWSKGISQTLSLILTELSTEWGTLLYRLDIPAKTAR